MKTEHIAALLRVLLFLAIGVAFSSLAVKILNEVEIHEAPATRLRTVEYEGHQWIIYRGNTPVHHPNCHCLKP